jgi:type IV secretion system protein VirB8
MLSKKNSPKIDAAVSQGVNFELSVADLAKRSERRAWMVAFTSICVSVMLAGGYYYMLPLKEKVPYIVLADPYSGTSSVARLSDDLINQRITASEAVNRSNIAHFVIARESYDVAITNMRDWPTVLTMASPNVAQAYTNLHSQNNPNRPFNLYGRSKAVRVKILSIVLIGGGGNVTPKGATVRFQRSLYDKTTGATIPLDSKIATLEIAYKSNLRMDDQSRVENPLGFQVLSYRVDNDYGDAAPVEVPATAPPTAGSQPAATPAATPGVDPDDAPIIMQSGLAPGSQQPSIAAPQQMPAQPAGTPVPQVQQAVPNSSRPSTSSAANGGRR